ncbi:MAG: hypothetical protein NVSMB47_04610 [Polyangiales bacterium]
MSPTVATMKNIHLEHEVSCSEVAFWGAFLSREFSERLFREVLGFPTFEVLSERDEGDVVLRECAAQPRLPPAQMALARLLRRRGFHFIERGRFDRLQRVWTWELEPNVLRTALVNRGTMRAEVLGPGRVRRIVDIELAAHVPLAGSFIERSAARRITSGWNESARFMNEWIAAHGASEAPMPWLTRPPRS